jgi:hypothetical protein
MTAPPDDKPGPRVTDRARAEQLARKEREAAALRDNLRKRKQQARARTDADAPNPPRDPE